VVRVGSQTTRSTGVSTCRTVFLSPHLENISLRDVVTTMDASCGNLRGGEFPPFSELSLEMSSQKLEPQWPEARSSIEDSS
jgi:hypothetical protein